jgi:hypothetical protein
MARKRQPGTIASTRITDEELIQRLQDEHPHILNATVGHVEFEAAVGNLIEQLPDDKPRHFYCRPCGEYHLKTHPHHKAMKARRKAKQLAVESLQNIPNAIDQTRTKNR